MGKRLFAHYFRSNLFPVMVSRFSQGTFSCTQIWSFSRVCKSKGISPIVTFWHKNEITYSNVPYRLHVFTSIVREIDPLEELLQIHDWTRYCRTDMPGWKIYKRNTLTAAAAAVVAAAASSEISTTWGICGHTPSHSPSFFLLPLPVIHLHCNTLGNFIGAPVARQLFFELRKCSSQKKEFKNCCENITEPKKIVIPYKKSKYFFDFVASFISHIRLVNPKKPVFRVGKHFLVSLNLHLGAKEFIQPIAEYISIWLSRKTTIVRSSNF